jgi:hypothetical protein
MFKQGYRNGFWNARVFVQNSRALALRHVVPFAFVCGLATLGVVGVFWWPCLAALGLALIAHLGVGLCYAARKSTTPADMARLPLLFLGLHWCYGTGTLVGVLLSPFYVITRRRLRNQPQRKGLS